MIQRSLKNLRIGVRAAVCVVCAGCSLTTAWAQFTGPAVGSPSPTAEAPASAFHVQYGAVRIRPGDVIALATPNLPELTTTAQTTLDNPASTTGSGGVAGIKVGSQGEVVLPYLGVVKLAGMTPEEASAYLDQDLKDKGILVNPQVSVSLVYSPTRVITVVGEVQRPAPVPAAGQLRLLDVIAACGGLTPVASHDITIRRPGDPNPITVMLGNDPRSTDTTNIPLVAGDTVIVPKVGNVFVVGEVKSPGAVTLSSNTPVTVMRAISMVGGVSYGAALSKVVIIRRLPDDQREEIQMDLKKVMHGREKDVALASDDVLVVPRNGFKATIATGSVITAAASAGVYTGIYRIP